MTREFTNVMIAGEAGQGLVSIGHILAKCLLRSGYSILVTQSYESRIRGGHNTFVIRMSDGPVLAPQESIDLLVALNKESIILHQGDLNQGGVIVHDDTLPINHPAAVTVPFNTLSDKRYTNVAALGIIAAVLDLEQTLTARVVEEFFGKKDEKIAEKNREALNNAFQWTATQSISCCKLPRGKAVKKMLMLDGSEAIAAGALAAGLKFYSFYPMTPATPIAVTLAEHAEEMGIMVEQAEDEIAAINMALGASFAGVRSMVGTSGGGFALMVEGVSLAGMTETPVVIVVAQRPGPATGLPTRTEQGDLEFILHCGHGEFARALFAPGSIEQCFQLTRQAFDLAERYQTPIFILTDHFLADSFRSVEPFDLDALPAIISQNDQPARLPYRRYEITDSGVSPRLLPGESENLVIADSDEHDEVGHITEDLTLRPRMVDKRLKKLAGLRKEVIAPEFVGDEKPDLLLLSWGSSRGACLEAAENLRAAGKKTAALHFSQVWPLAPEQFLKTLEQAGQVVCVESNAAGQLARLIQRESGFIIEKKVTRYDGLPITPEYIIGRLEL